jgi:WD40 repeat protein
MPSLAERSSANALKTCWETSLDDHVIRLEWSCAGVIAAACIGGPIHLLQSSTGITLRILDGHRVGTQCLSWSHDGRLLASGGQDGKVRIWNPNSDQPVRVLDAGGSWVEQVAFSPDGYLLATAAGRNLKLWNAQGELAQTYAPHPSTISDIQWQHQGLFLTSGCYGQLATFTPDTCQPIKQFRWKGSILKVAWSPDGNYVATGNQDASVHFWYRKTAKDLEMSGYPTKVRELSWDATSRYLATGGSAIVIIWDCGGKGPAGTRPIQLEAHETLLSALEYQRKGDLLASSCQNGLVCVWNPRKKQTPLGTSQLDDAATQIRWSPDDRGLVASSASGLVRTVLSVDAADTSRGFAA